MAVVGIDACKAGWCAVILDGDATPRVGHIEELDDLDRLVDGVDGVAIDMPIGIPSSGQRAADAEARRFVGARASSVFSAPVRDALHASTFAEANQINRGLAGVGLTQQAYALRTKILAVETWVASSDLDVWEVHPEVSFTVLMGSAPRASKKSWAGLRERVQALEAAGIDIAAAGDVDARIGIDDAPDAAVVAWSARRLVAGEAICLPDPPEIDDRTGRPIAIWA